MKHVLPLLLLDSPRAIYDKKRMAYAQDVFLAKILGYQLILCEGALEEGCCVWCGAPASTTPHPFQEELVPFSTDFAMLPDLMQRVLRSWPLPDIRLLGEIVRPDDPLLLVQDVIHVYQKRHPLGVAGVALRMERISREDLVEQASLQPLAHDVYFVPLRSLGRPHRYTAQLVIGRVVAHLHLSHQELRIGQEDRDEQWVIFAAEHVHIPLAERHQWYTAWHNAWQIFLQAMEQREREEALMEQEDLAGDLDTPSGREE